MMKEPKMMTADDWKQLSEEAKEILAEVEANKEELDKMMEELPPDFFDKMHDEIMEKIKQKEEQEKVERFLDFVFKQ